MSDYMKENTVQHGQFPDDINTLSSSTKLKLVRAVNEVLWQVPLCYFFSLKAQQVAAKSHPVPLDTFKSAQSICAVYLGIFSLLRH